MSTSRDAYDRPLHGRGGLSQGSLRSNWRSHSPVADGNELPTGDLLATINAADILPSDGPAQISNVRSLSSYNWVNSSKPIILVPGSPAIWSPPTYVRKLNADKGEVFIDQNAARYSAFPLEPMFRALYELHPELDLEAVDVVMCRNTMAKLFDFVSTNSKTFEIDVEIIGDKALFIRKEKQTTEFISEFRGFGHTFPEEYTRWGSAEKGSGSHHRIIEYEFSGLRYLLRFECDGYLTEKTRDLKKASQPGQESMADAVDTATLSESGDMLLIGEKRPVAGEGLIIRKRGSEIEHRAGIEIKTRAVHKALDMESVLPRLWMSQTSNLIAAYHKGGRFDDVRILDVGKDLGRWEHRNSVNLRKMNTLIRLIIDTVRNTISMKCRLRRSDNEKLEIRELEIGHQSALPDDLCLKLRQEKDLEDGKTRSNHSDGVSDEPES